VANVPRDLHEVIKGYCDRNGIKVKIMYKTILKLGWVQYVKEHDLNILRKDAIEKEYSEDIVSKTEQTERMVGDVAKSESIPKKTESLIGNVPGDQNMNERLLGLSRASVFDYEGRQVTA